MACSSVNPEEEATKSEALKVGFDAGGGPDMFYFQTNILKYVGDGKWPAFRVVHLEEPDRNKKFRRGFLECIPVE